MSAGQTFSELTVCSFELRQRAAVWYVGIDIADDSIHTISFPEHKVSMFLRNFGALPTRLQGIISQTTTV